MNWKAFGRERNCALEGNLNSSEKCHHSFALTAGPDFVRGGQILNKDSRKGRGEKQKVGNYEINKKHEQERKLITSKRASVVSCGKDHTDNDSARSILSASKRSFDTEKRGDSSYS
jgi:hypothetical protein